MFGYIFWNFEIWIFLKLGNMEILEIKYFFAIIVIFEIFEV